MRRVMELGSVGRTAVFGILAVAPAGSSLLLGKGTFLTFSLSICLSAVFLMLVAAALSSSPKDPRPPALERLNTYAFVGCWASLAGASLLASPSPHWLGAVGPGRTLALVGLGITAALAAGLFSLTCDPSPAPA